MEQVLFNRRNRSTDLESKPIKLWLQDLEEGALAQATNLAKLPFVFKHIALMPDCHQGYGMPIGGVMATKGVVVPNAVGMDIGCFDKDTEFLSPFGWKNISDWNGEVVAQFNPNTDKVNFVFPINYIKRKCDEFYYLKTKHGLNQMISEDHRCLVYKYDRSMKFNRYKVINANELYKKHTNLKLGIKDKFLTAFKIDRTSSVNYSDEELRVVVMFSADGHIDKNKIVLQFKKQQKIKRAEELLTNAKITYNKTKHKNETIRISFNRDFVTGLEKGLDRLWDANYRQLKVIVEEILYWDGDLKDKVFFTRKKSEADFIHYAISATGKRGVLRKDLHKDGRLDYRVYQHADTKVGIAGTPKTEIKKIKSVDGYKYSFTVPSSFLVTRREGNVVVTGNCGICAVKTSLTELDQETLKKIMGGSKDFKGGIRGCVPVGFRHQSTKQDELLMPSNTNFDNIKLSIVDREYLSALKQIGTLGGGNHFIEIQKGDDGFIWIMIHSGSRNLGSKVAKHYNDLATKLNEKWYSQVPKKWQLAFLPIDSDEGQQYLNEMRYCVEFALANRKFMLENIKNCVTNVVGDVNFEDEINIAHNYATMENHFGQNVMVHRKGATQAYLNRLGIIPGSQGASSHIVIGKGNKESFMSCSHGAGRKMSRTKAQHTLNFNEQKQLLEDMGVIHGMRNKTDLDEAPGAYKDIVEVMHNQEDLVSIKVKLTPLAVIKG